MTIDKTIKEDELTLALTGRLDTVSAPDLERELNELLSGIKSLVFDFAGLEYISSAGLRVLLAAQKEMNRQGSMVVMNVNQAIKEVFDITGFTDILTLK